MRLILTLSLITLHLLCYAQNCECGEEAILDAGSGYTSYLWSDGSTGQTLEIDPLCPSDSGNYSVTVTDACGTTSDVQNLSVCTASNVTINPIFYNNGVNCIFIANAPTCCNNPQYEWVDPCGSVVSTGNVLSSGGPQGNQITVCGTYTVNVVSCNGCTECSSSATVNITSPGPNNLMCCGGACGCVSCSANITSFTTLTPCNQPANYSATSCTNATYTWTVTLGATTVATGSTNTFSWTPTVNGTYTVTLTVLDDCGITSTDVVMTTVNNCAVNCDDCTGDQIQANNTPNCNTATTFSIPCTSAANVSWSVTGGGGTISGNDLIFTPTANGTYTVSISYLDGCGNMLSDSFTFVISDCVTCQDCTPENIQVSGTIGCNLPVNFFFDCSNASTFSWEISGSNITTSAVSTTANATYTPTVNGTYNMRLIALDDCPNNIVRNFPFTITDCVTCDCNVTMLYDNANCEIDYTVTGCDSWQLRASTANNCTGVTTVASGTSNVNTSYDICSGFGDGSYEVVALESNCPAQQSQCDITSCCCPFASIPLQVIPKAPATGIDCPVTYQCFVANLEFEQFSNASPCQYTSQVEFELPAGSPPASFWNITGQACGNVSIASSTSTSVLIDLNTGGNCSCSNSNTQFVGNMLGYHFTLNAGNCVGTRQQDITIYQIP